MEKASTDNKKISTAGNLQAGSQKFATQREVLAYLRDELGLEVSLSMLKRRSAGGILQRNPDGSYPIESVTNLAKTLSPKIISNASTPVEVGSLAEEKLREEIRKLRAQTEGIQHENAVKAGKYFRKADVWLELAHRASVLYAGLQQSLMAAVPTIARAALSDPTRAEDATRAAIEHALNDAINEFSRPMTLDVETWTQELGDDDLNGD